MSDITIKSIIEAALFAASQPLSIDQLQNLFTESENDGEPPNRATIRALLIELKDDYATHGIELMEVASGYRFQIKSALSPWIKRLWAKRSPRYSRALLETLAIIVYRQPITRTEIEGIRGVSVSTAIIKTLLDYQWIRVLTHRDTPGRPALYGTTKAFLDYFNLKSLDELPTLEQLQQREDLDVETIFASETDEEIGIDEEELQNDSTT